jgi:hypothetical protein
VVCVRAEGMTQGTTAVLQRFTLPVVSRCCRSVCPRRGRSHGTSSATATRRTSMSTTCWAQARACASHHTLRHTAHHTVHHSARHSASLSTYRVCRFTPCVRTSRPTSRCISSRHTPHVRERALSMTTVSSTCRREARCGVRGSRAASLARRRAVHRTHRHEACHCKVCADAPCSPHPLHTLRCGVVVLMTLTALSLRRFNSQFTGFAQHDAQVCTYMCGGVYVRVCVDDARRCAPLWASMLSHDAVSVSRSF